MKQVFLTLMLFIGILSCKDNDSITPNPIANEEFAFALVSSQEECEISISQGVNCSQTIIFENNTDATVIVTDIVNGGTYAVNGNTITVTFSTPGDAENPMVFQANNNFSELTRISDGSNDVWKLQIKGVAPWNL